MPLIVGVVVVLIGLGGISLGVLQLAGVIPAQRREGGAALIPAYVNILVGTVLLALGAGRVTGVL